MVATCERSGVGRANFANPVGICPMVATLKFSAALRGVKTKIASSGVGTMRASFLGVRYKISIVATPSASAVKFTPAIACGSDFIAATVPPTPFAPKIGLICNKIIINPTPLIKPDTTEYGINFTNFPSRKTPNSI